MMLINYLYGVCKCMPKWLYHKSIANILSIGLSRRDMDDIDSKLDGMVRTYRHDFWKYDEAALKEAVTQVYASYGVNGVKYCLLHILLDTFQENLVSEMTRETSAAKIMRNIAHENAFKTAISTVEYYREYIHGYDVIFEQFLSEVKSRQEEIMRIIRESPEVKACVRGAEKLKEMSKKAREIAIKYIGTGYDLPFYTNLILELWSDDKRGAMTKEEWAGKVLAEYKEEKLKGLRKDVAEKKYRNLVNIANSLGYVK